MSRWFRFYDDAINDPKALKLSDKTFRIWIGMLCLASKNDGALPPFEDMVLLLRVRADKLQPELERLIDVQLLDHDETGIRPHNWNKRQYKSDVSTERVKRFRNAKRNVSETPPETEADTESETEKKDSRAVAVATRTTTNSDFEDFWKEYPKRQGTPDKQSARKSFEKLTKAGTAASELVAAARNYAAETRSQGKENTEFVPMAATWLNKRRDLDYAAAPAGVDVMGEAERQKLFAELHGNGQAEKNSDLRGSGVVAREVEGPGWEEPAPATNH